MESLRVRKVRFCNSTSVLVAGRARRETGMGETVPGRARERLNGMEQGRAGGPGASQCSAETQRCTQPRAGARDGLERRRAKRWRGRADTASRPQGRLAAGWETLMESYEGTEGDLRVPAVVASGTGGRTSIFEIPPTRSAD
jgi:hypothetical protein